MPKIKDLNPTVGRIDGSDLAIPFRMPSGEIGFGWGDTFQAGGPWGPPMQGLYNWRSPCLTRSDTHDPSTPIAMKNAARNGGQLWDYAHNNPVFNTVLPTDFITIGKRIYGWFMVTKELGNEQWCEIQYSDDNGETWTHAGTNWPVTPFGGMRVMITWEKDPFSDWVYIMSTGGLKRNKGLLLWRVHQDELVHVDRWQGWGWNGKDWGWGRPPSDVLYSWKFGEINLRWIQGSWVFSAFDSGSYCAVVKVLKSPTDDMHAAPTYRPVTGDPKTGADHVPRLYGCYTHPDSTFDKFCMIVSEWAVSGNPYRAMQYRIHGIKPVNPIIEDPRKENNDMANADEVLKVLKDDGDKVLLHGGRLNDKGEPTQFYTGSMRDMLKVAAFEISLWFKRRGLRQLEAKKGAPDTMLGHAIDAASYGAANHALLKAIAEKQGVDVVAVLAPFQGE